MTALKRQPQLSIFGNGGEEFPARLKRLRLLRRWDQARLGDEAGLSTAAISNLELGRVSPTGEQIGVLASALGYAPEFLTAELRLVGTTRPWLRAYADASKRETDTRTAAASIAA